MFKQLKQGAGAIASECLMTTASGLLGNMAGITIEAILNNTSSVGPLLGSPIQMICTGTGMVLWVFGDKFSHILPKPKDNDDTNVLLTPQTPYISPRMNLWNQLALGIITEEDYQRQLKLISNT